MMKIITVYYEAECGDGVIGTQQLLGAYGERLAAARALRRLQEEGAHLVDAAVHEVRPPLLSHVAISLVSCSDR